MRNILINYNKIYNNYLNVIIDSNNIKLNNNVYNICGIEIINHWFSPLVNEDFIFEYRDIESRDENFNMISIKHKEINSLLRELNETLYGKVTFIKINNLVII
jgi:hypothetical protein